MSSLLSLVDWLAALIVLAEALNKLERTAPFSTGLTDYKRMMDGLKALSWSLLAMGASGALIGPFLYVLGMRDGWVLVLCQPEIHDVAILAGSALLIIRTRIKEG